MTRVKTGSVSRRKHKNTIKSNKGYYNSQSRLFKISNQENMKALSYSYMNRRKKKSEFKKLWIKRINATIRSYTNSKYNLFIKKLKEKKIIINRKILSKLCLKDINMINKINFVSN